MKALLVVQGLVGKEESGEGWTLAMEMPSTANFNTDSWVDRLLHQAA